ncbi:MAG TPA: tetratricopeptide repeat protein [Candidatus Polarisedimenticolaceae bacterium]|nr:tetratricopeptide repeat protein [Candidatus Polarisedimenticolaceae bacterium]
MKHTLALATLVAAGVLSSTAYAADHWWIPKARAKETAAPAAPDTTSTSQSAPASAAAPDALPPAAATATSVTQPVPDSSLAKVIARLREGPIGTEPNAVAYLDLIEQGRATPSQVNDFAAYLAKRGMPRIALPFQEYALKLDRNNPTLWLNLGTIQRTTGALGDATGSFKKTISLDPNNALAHYNLGSIYDAQKDYDAAIEEYRRALVLDPDLADPRKNPQVVNNENLLAVKLEIYQNQAGALGLPLLQMQPPVPAPKPEDEDKP